MPQMGDAGAMVSRMSFTDPWDAARFLYESAEEDAEDPIVRAWALAILDETAHAIGEDPTTPTLSPELVDAYGEALHANVMQIKFVHEPGEVFQSARATMALGAGDCDDHARLLYALALAGGLTPHMLFFADPEVDEPVHVVDAIEAADGSPVWAETTIGAHYGEEPFAALERLELTGAQSPLSHTASLGFLGLDFVTAENVRDRKKELDGYVQAIDADLARCTSLDAGSRASWASFKSGWDTFEADDPSWWDAGAQGRQAQEYTDQIRAWQAKTAQLCASSVPVLPETPPDQSVSVVKTALVVAGVVAVAFAVREVAKR